MKDHSVSLVRCGLETQPNQAARNLNGGNVKLKQKQSIEHDLNITGMIKCKENQRTKEQVLENENGS